jgi:glycosyltransferase involved in cell wall biosynthesis
MKILFLSVFSNHFFNWVLQLKYSDHELYWLDIHDSNTEVNRIDFVKQTVNWKMRVEYPGRYAIRSYFPTLDKFIAQFNNRKMESVLLRKIQEIKPDIIHSFEMHSACVPIVQIMKKNPSINWIYSSWGTDIFYYRNDSYRLEGMKEVFSNLDYMFSDCERDYNIAKNLGFNGVYLGTFPGGGGYHFSNFNKFFEKVNRKTILIKGYDRPFGRCINVLKAIDMIKDEVAGFQIVVYGANDQVLEFVNQSDLCQMKNLEVLRRISHSELMKLKGKALLYIGNNISDGMPNTMLEAIIMGAFPIQSNPGGATAEIIEDGRNGFLINDPENIDEIAYLIKKAINNPQLIGDGNQYNYQFLRPKLEREYIKKQVLEKYKLVEDNLLKLSKKVLIKK